jgi:alpha-N-arabinofuranosidase
MAVNLGTRGVEAAAELVEYCNLPDGTAASDLRRDHGVAKPYDVRLWCLGNEMDGPWQIGSLTAQEYGRLAARAGHAMKRVDPSIELVACGSSNSGMPTFGSWEATVLEHAYDQVDYISLHNYYDPEKDDEASFRASAVDLDAFVTDVVATADHVRAKMRRSKRIKLSLDEWNVWYQSRFTEPEDRGIEETPALIEDDYTDTDAMVVGNLLITMLQHADRLTVGCQAQLVNVIAPIRTEPGGRAWRQTIFHPFAHTARLARGTVLRPALTAPLMPTGRFGDVPAVDAVATHDEESGDLAVFVVNRGTEPVELKLDLRAFPKHRLVRHVLMDGTQQDTETLLLPPVSWHALCLTPEEPS